MHPVKELQQFLGECAEYVRSMGRYEELVTIEPAQAITADAAALESKIAAKAHQAEVYSLEALKAMEEAAKPESENGEGYSPTERARIKRLISRAAAEGHDASELATL